MDRATYKLDELASEAGVSARTVRYYVQRGLLPAPVFRGKDSAYDHEHLVRLRAIRRLQERFLPLDEIQRALDGRSVAELERIAEGRDAAPARPVAPAAPAPLPVDRRTTWTLAPGLELTLSEHASPEVRALADALVARAAAPKKH